MASTAELTTGRGVTTTAHPTGTRAASVLERAEQPAVIIAVVLLLSVFIVPSRYALGAQGFTISIPVLIGLGALLLWMLQHLVLGAADPAGRLNPARSIALLFLLYVLLSAGFAYARPLNSLEASGILRAIATNCGLTGAALLLVDGVRSSTGLRRVADAILIGAYWSGVVAIGQRLFGFAYNTWWASVPGLRSAIVDARTDSLFDGRALGTAAHPIELSVVCAVLIPLAVHHARSSPSQRAARAHAVGAAILVVGCLLAISRSGFIALIVVGIAILMTVPVRLAVNILGLLVGILALVQVAAHGTLSTLRYQLQHIGTDASSQGRTADYGPVFAQVDLHPWTGIGIGTYDPSAFRFLDNAWLGLLLGGGAVAVLLFAVLLLTPLVCSGRVRRSGLDPYTVGLVRAAAIGTVGLGVSAYFFDELSFSQTALILFSFLGLSGAAWSISEGRAPSGFARG